MFKPTHYQDGFPKFPKTQETINGCARNALLPLLWEKLNTRD